MNDEPDANVFEYNPWDPRKGPPWPGDRARLEMAAVDYSLRQARRHAASVRRGGKRWPVYVRRLDEFLEATVTGVFPR